MSRSASVATGRSAKPGRTADVCVLGAGRMGAAIATRLADSGLQVSIWNRSPQAAHDLDSARISAFADIQLAVAGASVILTTLFDGEAVVDVLLGRGVIDALPSDALLVDLTTMDVSSSALVASAADARGLAYVRGAISGNPATVSAGTATLLLSGPADALDRAAPVLERLTARAVRVGGADEVRVVKLALNAMLGISTQALAEAIVLVEASNVRREAFLAALEASVLASTFLSYKATALRDRTYTPTFATTALLKDLSLALNQAHSVSVRLPATTLVSEQLRDADSAGFGALDFLSLLPALQQACGTPPDVAPAHDRHPALS